jgi:hypothetical protein
MELKTLEQVHKACQSVARHFGDRCNSDSTLTAKEATNLVKAVLNAGNLLEMWSRQLKGKDPRFGTGTPERIFELLDGIRANLRTFRMTESGLDELVEFMGWNSNGVVQSPPRADNAHIRRRIVMPASGNSPPQVLNVLVVDSLPPTGTAGAVVGIGEDFYIYSVLPESGEQWVISPFLKGQYILTRNIPDSDIEEYSRAFANAS